METNCNNLSRTQEQLERNEEIKHRCIYESMVQRIEYVIRIKMEERTRRKRMFIHYSRGCEELIQYCIAFLCSEGEIHFTKKEELSGIEELDFILVKRFSALLKIKRQGEEVKIFSTQGKKRKLDLFSIWTYFGYEKEFQLATTKFMKNQVEILLYMKEYGEYKGNSMVNRISQIVYDGIVLEGKKDE